MGYRLCWVLSSSRADSGFLPWATLKLPPRSSRRDYPPHLEHEDGKGRIKKIIRAKRRICQNLNVGETELSLLIAAVGAGSTEVVESEARRSAREIEGIGSGPLEAATVSKNASAYSGLAALGGGGFAECANLGFSGDSPDSDTSS